MRDRDLLRVILSSVHPGPDKESVEEAVLEALARKTFEGHFGPPPESNPKQDKREFKSLLAHLDRFVSRLADFRAYAAENYDEWVEARDNRRAELRKAYSSLHAGKVVRA